MILDGMTADELEAIERIGTLREYAAGDVIIEEGRAGSSFFLLLAGRAEVRKHAGGRRYKRLVNLGPCDVVGEIAFLGVENRSASVVAVEPCQALEIDRKDFEALIERLPVVGLKAYRGMARELACRLARCDEDLMDAMVWALGQSRGALADETPRIPERMLPRLAEREEEKKDG